MKKTLLILAALLLPALITGIAASIFSRYLISIGAFERILPPEPFLGSLVFWVTPALSPFIGFLFFLPLRPKRIWLIALFYLPLMFLFLRFLAAVVMAAYLTH